MRFRLVWLCSLLLVPTVAVANSVVEPVDLDTNIMQDFPDNNMGAHTHVAAGSNNQDPVSPRRGLFFFDLTGILPGSTINSVTFDLDVIFVPGPQGPQNSNFDLHRITSDWGEGVQVGPKGFGADPNEATWNSNFHPTTWTTAGGDFDATASASTFVTGVASYQWSGAGLVTDVQFWVDNPLQNFGLLLKTQAEGTGGTARRFGSLDGLNGAELTVDFTPIPLPTAFQYLMAAPAMLWLLRRRLRG